MDIGVGGGGAAAKPDLSFYMIDEQEIGAISNQSNSDDVSSDTGNPNYSQLDYS